MSSVQASMFSKNESSTSISESYLCEQVPWIRCLGPLIQGSEQVTSWEDFTYPHMYCTSPRDALGHFTYGDLHPELKFYPQNIVKLLPEHLKISTRTINFFQNITKFCMNFERLSSFISFSPQFIHLDLYLLTQKCQAPPKIFNPKYRIDTPVCLMSECSPRCTSPVVLVISLICTVQGIPKM